MRVSVAYHCPSVRPSRTVHAPAGHPLRHRRLPGCAGFCQRYGSVRVLRAGPARPGHAVEPAAVPDGAHLRSQRQAAAGDQRSRGRPPHPGQLAGHPAGRRAGHHRRRRRQLLRQPRLRRPRRHPRHLPVDPQRLTAKRRLDHHPAAGQEHAPRSRTDRRAQDQRGLPGHGAHPPLLQGPDPRDVHERDLVRQSRLRYRSSRRDLLRQARQRADAARGVAAGRPAAGAVVLRPVHQFAGRQRAAGLRAGPDGPHRRHQPAAARGRRRGADSTWCRRTRRARTRRRTSSTYVRQLVEQQFGTEALFREGLQITTSLDLDLQHLAEKRGADHIADISARNATNAALVAIQPSSGEVLAMLGLGRLRRRRASTARSTSRSRRASQARRSSRSPT